MIRLVLLLLMLLASPAGARAEPAFEPRIGTRIDLSLKLQDNGDAPLPLAAIVEGKPSLVLFGYYRCPNLCGTTQSSLAAMLGSANLAAEDYRVLFITVDPAERAEEAGEARSELLALMGEPPVGPWHFLSGENVVPLADQFGIGIEQRARIAQIVHPVGVIAMTGDGRISRAFPGFDFTPDDLRLALVEASQGRLGSFVDQVFLFCAGFDTSRGQYSLPVQNLLRWGGLATVLLLGGAIALLMRERRP